MRTIITYKATETAPVHSQAYDDLAPSFDFEQDYVDLIDYDYGVVKEKIPLLSIESITWDEEENKEKIQDLSLDQIIEDYILLRIRAKVPVYELRKRMRSQIEALGHTFEEMQLKAIERYIIINEEE